MKNKAGAKNELLESKAFLQHELKIEDVFRKGRAHWRKKSHVNNQNNL